jgi:CRP-like cAMP-binding protein
LICAEKRQQIAAHGSHFPEYHCLQNRPTAVVAHDINHNKQAAAMNVQNYRAIIAQYIPINSPSQKHFEILLSKAEVVELHKNRTLFRRGDVDKSHFYLLEGELSIESADGTKSTVSAGTDDARQPISQHQPRQATVTALTPSVCLKIESKSLDMMLAWDNASNYTVEEVTPDTELEPVDWMGNLLKNRVFQKLHPVNLQAFFMKLEQVNHRKGDTVIAQGEPGDYFYVIVNGSVDIVFTSKTCPEGMLLATLGQGDFFGVDALIADHPRSASAIMKSDGSLMRLSKHDFLTLIKEPVVREITFQDAAKLARSGRAVLLDVRLPVEHNYAKIENSINFPLIYLRLKQELLDRDKLYITYCDSGGRSAAAAFLLQNHGLNACVLKGGLQATRKQAPAPQAEPA